MYMKYSSYREVSFVLSACVFRYDKRWKMQISYTQKQHSQTQKGKIALATGDNS